MIPLSEMLQSVLLLLVASATIQNQTATPVDITIDREGVLLKGRFYISEGIGSFPTVILLHGFPCDEAVPDVLGLGNELSKSGINALTFYYSGNCQSQGEFSFKNTQKDINAAYEFILQPENVRKYQIDTSRIFLGGCSYGGGMALTYAANHPEITTIFSIAGTDHGEFIREYIRNPEFQKGFDGVIESLAAPAGPVRFAEGFTLEKIVEMGIDKYHPNLDLRKSAPLLAQKNILLISGWDDTNITIEQHILPLYRALKNEKAENVKIVAFQDDHSFRNCREELAQTIIEWLRNVSTRKKF